MLLFKHAGREARALLVAALFGGGLSLAVGGAYLAGGLASAAADRAQISSLSLEARQGFSGQALELRTATMDHSALAIAQRVDPYNLTDAFERNRQGLVLVNRLDRSESAQQLRALVDAVGPTAEPFENQSALQSARDLDCLTTAVYFEARGESAAGQAAVAQVVLNRVRHPAVPRTICGVVFQGAAARGCQFSFACNGAMRRPREPAAWSRARDVAVRALSGFVMTSIGNATNFHTVNVAPGWSNLVRVTQVGTHIFYRFAGRNGSASAFNAQPQPSLDDAGSSRVAGIVPVTPGRSGNGAGTEVSLSPTQPSQDQPLQPVEPQLPMSGNAAIETSAHPAPSVTSETVTPASTSVGDTAT